MGYILKECLVEGATYEVEARNFKTAVWTGQKFKGRGFKFGMIMDIVEYHWDDNKKYGTVKPIRIIKKGDL